MLCAASVLCCMWIHLVEAKAAEGSFLWQEVAQGWRAADVGRVGRVALHKTEGRKTTCEISLSPIKVVSGLKAWVQTLAFNRVSDIYQGCCTSLNKEFSFTAQLLEISLLKLLLLWIHKNSTDFNWRMYWYMTVQNVPTSQTVTASLFIILIIISWY